MSPVAFQTVCPICLREREFTCEDDFWHCRGAMTSSNCEYNGCITRERAVAHVLFSMIDRDKVVTMNIHEMSPADRGLAKWLREYARGYVASGFFPNAALGAMVGGVRNEDAAHQTFETGQFDIVLHLDILEHLFAPFEALEEIRRTLKPGGLCLFSAPTDRDRMESVQVAFDEPGGVRIVGEPEYHGNPQRPEDGALVTWRYGHDLPLQIQRRTGFDHVEVRRFQSRAAAAMGYMSDVYVCMK